MQKLESIGKKTLVEINYLGQEIIEDFEIDIEQIKKLNFVVTANTNEHTVFIEKDVVYLDAKNITFNTKLNFKVGSIVNGNQLINIINHFDLTNGSEKFLIFSPRQKENQNKL